MTPRAGRDAARSLRRMAVNDDPRRAALAEAAGRQFRLVPGWLDVLDARELAELLALAPDFGARYGMGGGSGREMPVPFAAVREMFTGHPVIHAAVNLVAQIVADTEWEIQFAGRGADPDTGRDAARFLMLARKSWVEADRLRHLREQGEARRARLAARQAAKREGDQA